MPCWVKPQARQRLNDAPKRGCLLRGECLLNPGCNGESSSAAQDDSVQLSIAACHQNSNEFLPDFLLHHPLARFLVCHQHNQVHGTFFVWAVLRLLISWLPAAW
jgi:hypothetical protein